MSANWRRGWSWGVIVGIIAAVTVTAVRLWPHERSLLSRATRAVPLSAETSYCLLNDHEAITLVDEPHSRSRWQRHPKEWIYRQNLTTGQRLFLPALSTCFNRLPLNWNFEFQSSSDEKRLLLLQDSMRVQATILTTVDGVQQRLILLANL